MSRIVYFDVLRIIACMMIVLMHSPMPGLGTPGPVLSGISYLTAPGIGLFFMISGALVLNTDKPVEVFAFLKHRILKIAVPLVFWTAIYNLLHYLKLDGSGRGVMWFLWTLGGLYILSPILIRWLQKATKKEIQFYLCLWGITLCYPWLKLVTTLNVGDTSWLYYFHGYVGYFVLGHFLSKYSVNRVLLSLSLIFVTVALPLLALFMKWNVNFYEVFWYLSPSIVIASTFLFILANRLCAQKQFPAASWLAQQTFGIYLAHILVMRGILWHTEWMQSMNGILQIFVCFVLTLASALLITAIIKKIPYLRVVVG